MAWFILFIAGLCEIGWAVGLKYTDGFSRLLPSVLTGTAMVVSVILLGVALKTLRSAPVTLSGRVSVPSARRSLASSCSVKRPTCRALPRSA